LRRTVGLADLRGRFAYGHLPPPVARRLRRRLVPRLGTSGIRMIPGGRKDPPTSAPGASMDTDSGGK
jgi:hypothetical protein